MKLMEAINLADSLIPNGFSVGDKIRWLSELDGKIKREIIERHEGHELIPFSGYDTETDPDTELLAEHPYDGIYIKFIDMEINRYNGETARYNNAASVFEAAYRDYAAWVNRTKKPIYHGRKYW